MKINWMKELSKPDNNREFSELVHNYYKLANMRVMQFLREKYNIPKEDIPSILLAIAARFLNDSVYSVGVNLSSDYPITQVYCKEQLMNLLNVLNGEPLSQSKRTDIDTDIESGLRKFKEFIVNNAADFYV